MPVWIYKSLLFSQIQVRNRDEREASFGEVIAPRLRVLGVSMQLNGGSLRREIAKGSHAMVLSDQ